MVAASVLALQAGFAFYTAWLGFARPARLAGMLGLALEGSSGLNEMRSQYGGFFLALGLVQLTALAGLLPLEFGLLAGATTFGGLALGRMWSLAADRGAGSYTGTHKILLILDPLGFLLSLGALALIG